MFAEASSFSSADTTRIILWSGVLILILIVAFILVMRVKRRMKDEIDKNPAAATGFTLSDLRQMHRDGILTDEELEKAKAKIVQAARKSADRSAVPPPATSELPAVPTSVVNSAAEHEQDIIELPAGPVCPHCGKENREDAVHCAQCGAILAS